MQSLRITLYEVFGYFAPGLIGIAALTISVWSIYLPAIPLTADAIRLRPVFFCLLAFVAYIFGHFLQAVVIFTSVPKSVRNCVEIATLFKQQQSKRSKRNTKSTHHVKVFPT